MGKINLEPLIQIASKLSNTTRIIAKRTQKHVEESPTGWPKLGPYKHQ